MGLKIFFTLLCLVISSVHYVHSSCSRDRNVQLLDPNYLHYDNGFFFIHGVTTGEAIVIYKHPDDKRVFGQYSFKNEQCLYETVYYFVENGKYQFTNPYITNEATFNVTNKLSFVKNGGNNEIFYIVNPRGFKVTHNLGATQERKILPNVLIKKTPAPRGPIQEVNPDFTSIGKQNLKVSYLKNGENHIQFISKRNAFASIEGQYTFRTSDRKYHSLTYEVPLEDLDYNGMSIKEYEMSTEENFFKTGILSLSVNGTQQDVRYFVNNSGFHVSDMRGPAPIPQATRPGNSRRTRNQSGGRAGITALNARILNPTFSRPDLLTGDRSVQPGK